MGKSSKASDLVVYFSRTLIYGVGMSIGRPHLAPPADSAVLALSPFRGTDKGLIRGIKSRRLIVVSSTEHSHVDVIHNLKTNPFPLCLDAPRMPSRRPTHQPYRSCKVAVLEDQEG